MGCQRVAYRRPLVLFVVLMKCRGTAECLVRAWRFVAFSGQECHDSSAHHIGYRMCSRIWPHSCDLEAKVAQDVKIVCKVGIVPPRIALIDCQQDRRMCRTGT